MSFTVFVHPEIAFDMPLDGESRARIMLFIRSLEEEPLAKADFAELNADGEPQFSTIIDSSAVGYLVDLGKMEVTVNLLEPADG